MEKLTINGPFSITFCMFTRGYHLVMTNIDFRGDYSTRSILHGYKLILTSLLVLMGISTFTNKEFVIFCRVSKIGNVNIPNHDSSER